MCSVRAEGDGEHITGGEEELHVSDSRTAETDRRAEFTGEEGAAASSGCTCGDLHVTSEYITACHTGVNIVL